jgi:hypothetical protein
MADTVLRLRILRTLSTWLEATGAGEARFNLGVADMTGRVFRGRAVFGAKDPVPMISILEVPIPLDQIASPPDSPYSSGTWELVIQGFAKDDKVNPTDPAHDLMAATKKRLAEARKANRDFNILGMGKKITGLRIGAGVVRPPDEISEKAYFWLNLGLDVVEDLSDPFEN